MALPNIMRRLFRNDGYGPLLRTDIVPFVTDGDLASSAADAAASTKWVKDLADAEVYVDASVASSGDGFTAATAVKTIGEGIAILQSIPVSSKLKYRLTIAGGTYNEDIEIHCLHCYISLLGNVTINGFLHIYDNSIIDITSVSDYTLTVTKNSSAHIIDITNSSRVFFYCKVVVNCSDAADGVSVYHCARVHFISLLTINAISSVYNAVKVGNAGWFEVEAGLTVTGDVTRCVQVYDAGIATVAGVINVTAVGFAFAADNTGVLFLKPSTATVNSAGVAIASGQSCVVISTFSSFVFNKTGSGSAGNAFMSQYNSYLVINTNTANAKLKLNLTTAISNVFHCNTCSTMMISNVKTIEYSGSCTRNAFVYSNSVISLNTSITMSGSLTGQRYDVSKHSYIATGNAGANRFPGSTAGVVDTPTYGLYR